MPREEKPFPDEWRPIVERNVPMVKKLPAAERAELEKLVMAFLDDKKFEGALDFEITDEVRVTIAAQACVLLLHRDTEIYPELGTIIVYPSTFRSKQKRREGYVEIEEEIDRLGESWSKGQVILAWDSVRSGTANIKDGHNVVIHEFAHQLDAEDGSMDGAPELGKSERYKTWAAVLGPEYEELVAKVEHGRRSDIDGYAATNPAEFFAVITETFFEKPFQLNDKHPDLFAALMDFYKQDPRTYAKA